MAEARSLQERASAGPNPLEEERENALSNVEAEEKRVTEEWEEAEARKREARYQEKLAQELQEEKEWHAAHYFAKYGTPEEKEEALEHIQFERQKAEREMHAANVVHKRIVDS